MDEQTTPVAGMTVSVRSRQDVVIVDPERFLAAARQAYRELNPHITEAGAAEEIADIYSAVHAILDRQGRLTADAQVGPTAGRGAPLPGERTVDSPDGLSPAGHVEQIVINEPMPLQDYGCFVPEDPFALPGS